MSLLDIAAILFGLSALFGYLNHRFLRLPHTIGIVVIALAASLTLIAADQWISWFRVGATLRAALDEIDFPEALLHGALSALLFAGAVHADLPTLAERRWAIGLMASVGVLISTVVVAVAVWAAALALDIDLPFAWALVFGALISPTDPVAVLGILKTVRVPRMVEAKIAGESLFNDGFGVVAFTVLLALAVDGDDSAMSVATVAELFAVDIAGGAALGLAAGWVAFVAMRSIDEHNLEVMITLALVTGVYALALRLDLSGPIAVVVAGLLIGNHGVRFAMSERTRAHVFRFWELLDEILNSMLFLMIGLEVMVIIENLTHFPLAVVAIPAVLAARFVSVGLPIGLLALRRSFERGAIRLLTWGGLRGGISVALALSLPEVSEKSLILTMTYAVVVFSIVVQGLTMKPLARRLFDAAPAGGKEAEAA